MRKMARIPPQRKGNFFFSPSTVSAPVRAHMNGTDQIHSPIILFLSAQVVKCQRTLLLVPCLGLNFEVVLLL